MIEQYPRRILMLFLWLFVACSNDDDAEDRFDTTGFEAITEPMRFGTLAPNESYEFLEFRVSECGSEGSYQIIYTEGEKCIISAEPSCLEDIDSLRPEFAGYDTGCLPACCSEYLVAQLDGENILIETLEELTVFLAPINSISDALVLVDGHGYFFSRDDVDKSGIKTVTGGYEIIALRTTAFCDPITTTQYLLFISEDGTIEIRNEREESREDGVCI